MKNTLHLFDELLEHDPGSKIFFPLARLYRRHGYIQRAIEIVQKGIELHPDYLEAQFFLIELLYDTGDANTAESHAHELFQKFLVYEKFWFALQSYYLKKNQDDLHLGTFLINQRANQGRVDLLKLLASGIAHYSESKNSTDSSKEPEHDLDAEEVTQFFINSGIKTKTMAKLLAAQGEHSQAIAICDELLSISTNTSETTELKLLREQSLQFLQELDKFQTDKTTKLYKVLNNLATRLENRASVE